VILEKPLGLEVTRGLRGRRRLCGEIHEARLPPRVPRSVDVAGDELQPGVLVDGAALVVDRDPAGEVGERVGRVEDHHVVRLPGDPARQVGRLDALRPRRLVPQEPHERRLGDEVLGQGGQHEASVLTHVDRPVDLEDRPVRGEQPGLVVRPVRLVEAHRLADVLLHELRARQEVVLVVLLEDPQPRRLGERLQVHGGRVDLRRDLHELDLGRPRGNADFADVLHEAEVAVVDRHHHVALILASDALGRGGEDLGGGEEHEQHHGDRSRPHRRFLLCRRVRCLARLDRCARRKFPVIRKSGARRGPQRGAPRARNPASTCRAPPGRA